MYCVYCNHPLKGDEKECPSCGRPAGTFVQIEAFRNGKGQKAAAAALDDLAFPQSPEDISAKIVSMGKEIKALRKENESLKKEQTELRALLEECRTTTETRKTPDDGGRGSKRGGLLSAVLTAAIAALIPLVALVMIYTGLSKKNADLEQKLYEETDDLNKKNTDLDQKLYEATDRIDQRINSMLDEIIIIQKGLAPEGTEEASEEPSRDASEEISGEPARDASEEMSEESVTDASEEISEESVTDASEEISEESVRNASEKPSGKAPADTYGGSTDENPEQYAPFYPSGYPGGYPTGI